MTLLTVDEFREHVTTALVDDAVQRLLDAAEEAIIRYAGPYLVVSGLDDQINELLGPVHGPLLQINRRAASIETVIENAHGTATTLAADDYELRSSGLVLRRLHDGTNPRYWWHGLIDVTYTPWSDAASRKVAQLELVKLDIAFNPTLASQTIGAWTETYQTGKPYPEQREDVLASLSDGVGLW